MLPSFSVKKQRSKKTAVLVTAILYITAVICVDNQAMATDWDNSSNLELQTIYNDNIKLSSEPHDSVKGTITDIRLGVTAATEKSQFSLTPKARFERYDNATELDNNLQSIPLVLNFVTGRSQMDLSLEYSRDNTLISEVADTGLVNTNKRRVKRNIAPSYAYMLNERNTAQFSIGYTSVGFEDAQDTTLVDYTVPTVNASHVYALTETAKLTSTLYGSKLKAPKVQNITSDYGIRLMYGDKISEVLSYSVQIGRHKSTTNIEYFPGYAYKNVEFGRLLSGDIAWNGEYFTWKLALDNSIEPSSAGVLVERNKLSINVDKRINRFLKGSLIAGGSRNKDVNHNDNLFSDWESRSGATSLSWRLKREWYLRARYDYYWRKFYTSNSTAESNRIVFSLLYQTK